MSDFYVTILKTHVSPDESTELKLIVNKHSGKASLVISKTITESFDVTDHEAVEDLYDKITSGNGRVVKQIKDFI